MLDYIRKIDAFPKAVDDIRVKTKVGATMSLLAMALMLYLFALELYYYSQTEIIDHLFVNNSTKFGKLKVDFDLSFPMISCNLLSIDVLDDVGTAQSDAVHNIYKFKIGGDNSNSESQPLLEKVELGDTIKSETHFNELSKGNADAHIMERDEPKENGCGDCYGAGESGECCNTCDDIRKLYELKGWRFKPQGIKQCEKESTERSVKEEHSESGGCQIFGQLELSRSSGHFYIAPHKSIHNNGLQSGIFDIMELLSFAFDQFNITHTINSLSFGDQYPGIKSPLDGHNKKITDTHGMYQYYVKVVPTQYHHLNGYKKSIESNQYSVTEHMRHLAPGSGRGLPGVYFYYEVSPIQAVFEERRHRGNLGNFLTSICAIVGGAYTVMGVVDSIIYSYILPIFISKL